MPILDKENIEEMKKYEEFLKNSKYIHMYQSTSWAKVKSDNWDNKVVYLEEDNKIVASMSVLIRTFGKVFTMAYAPRGPVCDMYDINKVQELIKEVEPMIKKRHAFVFKMDPPALYTKELEDLYKQNKFKVVTDFKNILDLMIPVRNMILNLEGKTEEDLLKSYSSKTRYNIRLAERKGVKVRFSQDEKDLKTFYELMKITAIRDGIPLRGYNYFKTIVDSYPKENVRIYLSEYEGIALSAAIAINYGKTVEYFYGASSNEKRNLMPNYLIQQNMIRWALETGCNKYNFGGVFTNKKEEGLYRFKEGFCGKEGSVKFIGEINKVYKPFYYFLFVKIMPTMKCLNTKLRKK